MKSRFILITMLISMCNLFALNYDIKLTEKQLQNKIEKKFPFEKKKFLTKVILSKPNITLKDGSEKVYINVDITLKVSNKMSFDAYTELNGVVIYNDIEKKFYLDDFVIDELVMDKVPLKFHKTIQKSIEKIAKIIFSKHHVYDLAARDFKNLKTAMAAMLLKNIEVKDKTMIITVGYF